jgi:predicted nucleotidyltransferase
MDITEFMSTRERLSILEHLLYHPSDEIVPDRVAKKAKVSRSQAHKYVTILRKQGLVAGRRMAESPLVQALRALLNVKKVEEAGVDGILKRHFQKMKGWGLFGSWAAGTNSEGSDLDIWMKLEREPQDLEMARAKSEISGKLGVGVDLVAATPQRLEGFRKKSDAFYYSLYNGKLMRGEGL